MSPCGRRRGLRVIAMASILTAGLLALLPATGQAAEPTMVGWWYRDIPLSGGEPQGAAVTGQSTGAPVVASLAGPVARPPQVPPLPPLPPPTTIPPPPTIPPLPVPTIPPDITIPDPGGNVPTPIPVPAGGLLVANDPTGMRGIAAMRFDAPGAGGATVILKLAPGSTPSPAINACPALSDWLPGPDQAWSARPAHDCDRMSVSGSLSTDGTTMTWALPDTFQRPDSATYDVLLVPVGSDGTPYQVLFDKPGADAFEVTSPFPEEVLPPELPLFDDVSPPIDTFSPDGFDVGGFDVGGFDGGAFPESSVTTPGVVSTERTGQTGPLGGLVDVLENPTVRRIATAVLVALGAYAYWQSNQVEQRAPRLLGALSGPSNLGAAAALRPAVVRQRGIGRFARDRTERPSPL